MLCWCSRCSINTLAFPHSQAMHGGIEAAPRPCVQSEHSQVRMLSFSILLHDLNWWILILSNALCCSTASRSQVGRTTANPARPSWHLRSPNFTGESICVYSNYSTRKCLSWHASCCLFVCASPTMTTGVCPPWALPVIERRWLFIVNNKCISCIFVIFFVKRVAALSPCECRHQNPTFPHWKITPPRPAAALHSRLCFPGFFFVACMSTMLAIVWRWWLTSLKLPFHIFVDVLPMSSQTRRTMGALAPAPQRLEAPSFASEYIFMYTLWITCLFLRLASVWWCCQSHHYAILLYLLPLPLLPWHCLNAFLVQLLTISSLLYPLWLILEMVL